MADNIRIPPIVGVPFFFKWLLGPSSLTVCPALSLFRKGMITGPKNTLTRNEMRTGRQTDKLI
ncbi:hypothetical protein K070079E91_19330 [Eisenbergiella porci]